MNETVCYFVVEPGNVQGRNFFLSTFTVQMLSFLVNVLTTLQVHSGLGTIGIDHFAHFSALRMRQSLCHERGVWRIPRKLWLWENKQPPVITSLFSSCLKHIFVTVQEQKNVFIIQIKTQHEVLSNKINCRLYTSQNHLPVYWVQNPSRHWGKKFNLRF